MLYQMFDWRETADIALAIYIIGRYSTDYRTKDKQVVSCWNSRQGVEDRGDCRMHSIIRNPQVLTPRYFIASCLNCGFSQVAAVYRENIHLQSTNFRLMSRTKPKGLSKGYCLEVAPWPDHCLEMLPGPCCRMHMTAFCQGTT